MRIISRLRLNAVNISPKRPLLSHYSPCNARWSSVDSRQWSTPLAKTLAEAITTTGPISVAAYTRQCLTSPDGGYYTSKTEGRDQFGRKGDFITSPEISQIFGELVGIWFVAEWIAQGRKSSGIQLMEVGPGRGTLMDDVLRTIRNFKPLASSLETIHLVEASPSLRQAQHKLLCQNFPLEEIDIGFRSKAKYFDVPIVWCEDMRSIPRAPDQTSFIVAHEFFDALPIHIFQAAKRSPSQHASKVITSVEVSRPVRERTGGENEWREMLVSPVPQDTRPAIAPGAGTSVPEFQLAVSKTVTPHSKYLPEVSPRYKALKPISDAIIEVSPESLSVVADFATRIGGAPVETSPASKSLKSATTDKTTPSGAALIIDYGPSNHVPTNSLRGIRAHRPCSPFELPGQVDISADVDFLALAEAAINASPSIEVHGPVEQATFLSGMGIKERAEMLMKRACGEGQEGHEMKKRVEDGWKRLVDRGPQGMGKIYKAMAIVPHVPGVTRRPVGFGGDITL